MQSAAVITAVAKERPVTPNLGASDASGCRAARPPTTTHRVDCTRLAPRGSARMYRSSWGTHRRVLRAPALSEYHSHFPADGWQTSAGTHRHTPHPSSIMQICSPDHPFWGPRVDMVRWGRRQPADSVSMARPDAVAMALPAWRRAPVACPQRKDAWAPSVSTDALLALDARRKRAGGLRSAASAPAGLSPATGGRDGPASCGPARAPGDVL